MIGYFSFLKNVFLFLIDRLYKEWVYICGNGRSYSEEASERADLYAKQLIENIIHDRARTYDPYVVDGISLISYGKTRVVLGGAHLTGLSTLHRSNMCFLIDVGTRVFINGTFGAGPLTYQREIMFEFGNFKREISVLVSLMDIKVSVDFSIEKETGRNGFLLNFAVNEMNGLDFSINGLGYFDWTINLVLGFLTLVLGRMVRNLLENKLEQYILRRLPQYQFPVEGTSYKKETKFNIPPEDVQKNDASLSETFCLKQNYKMPKWSRVSPIAKKSMHDVGKGYNSIEYDTTEEFGFNLETTKTSRSFLQNNNRTTEVNGFCLSEQSLGLCSESLRKNYCNEVSEDKRSQLSSDLSALSRETLNISRSLNGIKEKLASISHITNSTSQGITSKNRLEDPCPLFDCNIPDELNDISETESNGRENTASVISSPAKGFELKGPQNVSFLYKRWGNKEKESKMEDSSQMLRDLYRDLGEIPSEDLKENTGQSELLDNISSFFKIHENYCRKNVDENGLDVGIKLPTRVANYDSSPSMKMELSPIDVNILEREAETFIAEGGTLFAPTGALKMFNEEIFDERNGKIEYLNKNQRVSVESCTHYQSLDVDSSASNLDLKLWNADMFQNYFLNTSKDDGLAKDPEVKVLVPENETQIKDSESIKSYTEILSGNQSIGMHETRYLFYPDDKVDGQSHLKSNIISDSMEAVVIKDENFDSETETEMISTSLHFSEKYKDEVNEKIPFKYAEGYIGEDELNEDSLNKADEGFHCPRNNEQLNTTNFQNEDTTRNNLLGKLASLLNENDSECPDCAVEFRSIAGLKSNADSHENSSAETPDLKSLHDLQIKIIAKIHKLKSDLVLESDSEDNAFPGRFPVSSCKDLEYATEGLGHDEVNRLLQKDSKINNLEVSSFLEGDSLNSSSSESSTEYDIEIFKLAASKINTSEHEKRKFIEKFNDSSASKLEMKKIDRKY